ncbi:bifunctional DNA-formamidopyrimidine glycosylase/DNA-(apurinic or apyrimidinic site) lyase [Lacticaseibacillus paracasei]|uniref:bifunctional DNA-formamidopyrimidine glycosylase/DNA-(apurinic or apyrimidinic site) lyase n=1 Tax=Lacticaseibacillus paracasei TaxID=1597 RepID=UPI0008DD7665|nr:bifunctional DNA-formamidopyrimidine glycosylase/DNA-(apurinic or apyrimidinic site) lyase [Lacticaseibacillus paracasei]OHY54462.1 DNA-formamidopyrimidine glycosylase [Lacticaseibacillus paracasei]
MPELPEVETVRRSLLPLVKNKVITAINTNWEKILINGLATFQKEIVGSEITTIDRRGKYLLMRLSNGETIISHLRMEGRYYVVKDASTPFDKHDHVTFTFQDGSQLRYRDLRKFGRMRLIKTGQEDQVPALAKLGPEPTPSTFDETEFARRLKRHHKPIKSVLLDQTVVAGVGNIYADEVLWLSQLNPLQPADTLKSKEIKTLHDAIIQELNAAIAAGGTSAHTYVDAEGNRGSFQNALHVYDREGTPCDRCGTTIVKIKVGQRGTHYCPHCQPLHQRRRPA